MSICIIHIGTHKTGSTSIQEFLQNFQDENFTYAKIGDLPNHGTAIYDLFTHESEFTFFDSKPDHLRLDYCKEALLQAIKNNQSRTMIISGEKISVMHPNALVRMKDFLAEHFDYIRIVGYVRPPGSYLASAFQQILKVRSPTFEPMRLYRSYKNTFEKFDTIFNESNVELYKFDRTLLLSNCSVTDLCYRIGIKPPNIPIKNENESMSRQFVGLLYVYRKFAPELAKSLNPAEVEALNGKLSSIWSDKFSLGPELIRALHEHHAEDVAWMERRLGQSLQEYPTITASHSVNTEADLIGTDPATIKQLRSLLGRYLKTKPQEKNPAQIAQLFHELRILAALPGPVSRWRVYIAKISGALQHLTGQS